MKLAMDRELACLSEALPTDATHEGFLAGMCVNMFFEVLAEDERLIAEVAFVWAVF